MTKRTLLSSFFLLIVLLVAPAAHAAGPMDKLVQFYTSSLPNPPRIDIDVKQVWDLAETGDVIIENNRGFPQWYAAIGLLVPGTRYVHAGMVIKGHALMAHLGQLAGTSEFKKGFHAYVRCLQTVKNTKGESEKVWQWVKAPIEPDGKYVITPEVTRGNTMSRVVALHLKHYLSDPAIGYPCKHIKVIRPPVAAQKALTRLAVYLTYHVIKQTGYDMGFVGTEDEPAIKRTVEGELTVDLSLAPVPLYCTELVWRALREADVAIPPTHLAKPLSRLTAGIPKLPRGLSEKLRADFITADLLALKGLVIYANAVPPKVHEVIGAMVDQSFKETTRKLAARFEEIMKQVF